MTRYIVWDIQNDAAVRAAYFSATGEDIQTAPPPDDTGARRMAGSSRLTAEQAQILLADPALAGVYIGETPPEGWVLGVMPGEEAAP